MSIIDNKNHSVVAYTPGTTKAFAGQRLAVINYRTIKDADGKESKKPSKCVSIPLLEEQVIKDNISALLPWITAKLVEVQDSIIREAVDNGAVQIATDSINTAAVIGAAITPASGADGSGRLTKELIAGWYKEYLEDNLLVAISTKLGVSDAVTAEEAAKVQKLANAFKESIEKLAGPKTFFKPEICTKLLNAIDISNDDGKKDVIYNKLVCRVKVIMNESLKQDNDILNSL